MKKSILFACLLALASVSRAEKIDGAPQADCDGLSIATGPAGKGYSKLFADMKKISGGKLALCEVNTEGGLDNLTVLSTKGADVGIVPIDALKHLAVSDESIQQLQVVATMNSNFLHVIVSAAGVTYAGEKKWMGLSQGDSKTVRVTRFTELRGQPVAVVGSAQLMVRALDKALGMNMRIVDVSTDTKAFDMVAKGQVLAVLTTAGWPHGAVKNLPLNSGLTIAPFDAPIGAPYNVRPLTYKNLGVYNVQALSVPNVLVTRPFSGAAKIQEVASLKRLLADNLVDLKDGKFEPAWNEIKSLDGNVDWARFKPPAAGGKKASK